jgi:hypothetical protein
MGYLTQFKYEVIETFSLPHRYTNNFTIYMYNVKSCDSSVGIAMGYGMDDRGSRV